MKTLLIYAYASIVITLLNYSVEKKAYKEVLNFTLIKLQFFLRNFSVVTTSYKYVFFPFAELH